MVLMSYNYYFFFHRYESEVIDEIVDKVLCEVNPACLNVAKYPIGMGSHVQDIKYLLNLGRRDVRIVGIYGMGGIGKTTLAKAVYNEINDAFDGSSFLFNLKEEMRNGITHLQEQLLHDILKTKLNIGNFDRGISIIEKRIYGKKVLVVLDDVADLENLHKLVKKERLGPGSRIIVTTRDENVLSSLEVDKKYEVKELNYRNSLRLFSWHAFNMASPKEEYLELSKEALDYAGGIPLALELLGSFLKVISIVEWRITLEKLRRAPLEKIQNILRISFDALDVDTKNIFLDITCFFLGMDKDKDYVIQILDGCGFFPDIGIKTLTKRSLLTIDHENKFRMHGLIRDMGREIIRKKPEDLRPTLLGERSRLWFHKDVLNVLRNHTVRGICIYIYK
jgi:nucleoside-triphosphatase THEP1